MLILGHIGVGYWLLRPLKSRVHFWPVLFGTLLPDLIDKPLYFGMAFLLGKHGRALGLICGTRTVGHTLLILFPIGLCVYFFRREWTLSVLMGALSHYGLDLLGDWVDQTQHSSALQALVFPLFGAYFLPTQTSDIFHMFLGRFTPYNLCGELLGSLSLYWGWRTRK